MSMYKLHKIIRRGEGGITIYVCLQRISDLKHAVHQMHFVPDAIKFDEITGEIDADFLELFSEISPDERCEWFSSIAEAIIEHDRQFYN